ncbi:hypothetical protein GW17_00042244, partial [Ensete ventricosum]
SFYSGCCGLFVPDDLTAFMTHHVAAPHALPPYWWGSVRLQVGVADLTCARSVVRHLVPFVHPVDRSRRFGHVSGLAVRSMKAEHEEDSKASRQRGGKTVMRGCAPVSTRTLRGETETLSDKRDLMQACLISDGDDGNKLDTSSWRINRVGHRRCFVAHKEPVSSTKCLPPLWTSLTTREGRGARAPPTRTATKLSNRCRCPQPPRPGVCPSVIVLPARSFSVPSFRWAWSAIMSSAILFLPDLCTIATITNLKFFSGEKLYLFSCWIRSPDMVLAPTSKVVLGSVAFGIFWVLAVFPAVPFLPIGRTAGSLLSAMLMVIFGVISPDEAYAAIDLPILGLLFGTMVVSAYLEGAGLFVHLGTMLAWKSKGRKDLLCRICVVSAISSALFTNDTCCVVLTGFVLKIARQNNLPPQPFLLALASSSNIGSAATPIGNPQNLVIAAQSKISFGKFLLGLLPAMLVGVLVNSGILLAYYWKQLSVTKDVEANVHAEDMIAGDEVTSHRFSPATMSHVTSVNSEEWNAEDTILRSPSMNGGIGHTETLRNRTEVGAGDRPSEDGPSVNRCASGGHSAKRKARWKMQIRKVCVYLVTVGMLVALLMGLNMSWSALTAALTLIILDFKDAQPFLLLGARVAASAARISAAQETKAWLILAWVSTVAGNLSLLGSAANLIVCEQAQRVQSLGYNLSFFAHLRFGFLATLVVTVVGLLLIRNY